MDGVSNHIFVFFVKLLLLKIVKMCECMENAKTIYEVVVEPCTKK